MRFLKSTLNILCFLVFSIKWPSMSITREWEKSPTKWNMNSQKYCTKTVACYISIFISSFIKENIKRRVMNLFQIIIFHIVFYMSWYIWHLSKSLSLIFNKWQQTSSLNQWQKTLFLKLSVCKSWFRLMWSYISNSLGLLQNSFFLIIFWNTWNTIYPKHACAHTVFVIAKLNIWYNCNEFWELLTQISTSTQNSTTWFKYHNRSMSIAQHLNLWRYSTVAQ